MDFKEGRVDPDVRARKLECDSEMKNLNFFFGMKPFDAFYDIVLIKVQQYSAISEPTVPRKRCAPARYEMGNTELAYPDTARDHYRKIYFEAVDHLISSLVERFSQPAFKVLYANLETLLPKAAEGPGDGNLTLKLSTDVNVNSLAAHDQLCTFRVLEFLRHLDGSDKPTAARATAY